MRNFLCDKKHTDVLFKKRRCENDIFILVGTAVLIIGIILGLVISFRAMIKYNKGIF